MADLFSSIASPLSNIEISPSTTSTAPMPTTSKANLCSNINEDSPQEEKQEDNNDKQDVNVCTTSKSSKVHEHVQVEQIVEDQVEPQERNDGEVKDKIIHNQIRRIYMCQEPRCTVMYKVKGELDHHMYYAHGKTGYSCNARACTANHYRSTSRIKNKSKRNILTRLICKGCGKGYRSEYAYQQHISNCGLGKIEKKFLRDLQNRYQNLQYFSQESLFFILKWVEDATNKTTKVD